MEPSFWKVLCIPQEGSGYFRHAPECGMELVGLCEGPKGCIHPSQGWSRLHHHVNINMADVWCCMCLHFKKIWKQLLRPEKCEVVAAGHGVLWSQFAKHALLHCRKNTINKLINVLLSELELVGDRRHPSVLERVAFSGRQR